jgi:adenylylsulfate kinase-like enzyme
MRVKSGSNAIFPGLTEQYQKSDNPELILKTGSETFRRSSDKLIEYALKAIKI